MEKKILYDSPEAAYYRTNIEGWVSSDGRFFGKDEHMARYAGCTHTRCECGGECDKGYTHCAECRRKRSIERYKALPYKHWDGEEPICTYDGDKYFFDEESLVEWLDENEFNGTDVMLVICQPIYHRKIDGDDLAQDAHDEYEPPQKLVDAMKKMNEVISTLPPHSYMPGKIRTSYDYTYVRED